MLVNMVADTLISIHALHEESDVAYPKVHLIIFDISIHALHEESDNLFAQDCRRWPVFQSTLSMRRATICTTCHAPTPAFQSTLSMRRATFNNAGYAFTLNFNPRSP